MRFFSSAVGIGPSVAAMGGCNAACGQDEMSESGPPIKYAARTCATRDVLRKRDARPNQSPRCLWLREFIIMSALPPAEHPNNNGQPNDANKSESADSSIAQAEVAKMDTTPDQPPEETWDDIPEEIMDLDTEDVLTRIRLIDNDIKVRCFPFVAM